MTHERSRASLATLLLLEQKSLHNELRTTMKAITTNTSTHEVNIPIVKHEIGIIVRDIVVVFAPIFGFCVGATELAEKFGIDILWLKPLGLFGFYFVAIHALVIGLAYSTIKFVKRWKRFRSLALAAESSETDGSKKLSSELVKIVERSYKNKDYLEVVRFGSPLSRPLLLSGMHAMRASIGERIADAAAKNGMHEEQVVALIDDVGWSNALLGNIEKAVRSIEYGVTVAKEHQLHYYSAKGERHLAGVYQWYRKDTEKAHEHYSRALSCAEKIKDKHAKDEMKAGMLFGQADLYRIEGKCSDALRLATESKNLYQKLGDQEERLVKSYSQLGRILISLGELQKAEDTFHAGFTAAQNLRRKDEMGKSLLGLGEVHLLNNEYPGAIENLNEALQIFDELEMKQEAKEAKDLRAQAEVAAKQGE